MGIVACCVETELVHRKLAEYDGTGGLELAYTPGCFDAVVVGCRIRIGRLKTSAVAEDIVLVFDSCRDAIKGTQRTLFLVPLRRCAGSG